MSVSSTSNAQILVLIIVLCGVVCVAGYLIAFALSRRLAESGARPMIGVGELVKPLACGMLLGMVILACRLTAPDQAVARTGIQAIPHFQTLISGMTSVLLAVGLAGLCGGGWAARLRGGRMAIAPADLVRRLCIAGDTREDAAARVAVRLALAAGYNPGGASDLLAAASLHDVGHAGISRTILDKHDALDAAERRVLQTHTRIGYRMLARCHEPMLDLAADIALHHHEHWDGSGYPDGLSKEAIPLTSRATAIAVAFDSLLSTHCGQVDCEPGGAADRASLDEVARCLRGGIGTRFEPRLVALLLADLPGMIAARGPKPDAARGPAGRPVAAWLRPGRLHPLSGGLPT